MASAAGRSTKRVEPVLIQVQLRSRTGFRTIPALLDSGATENIISEAVVRELGLEKAGEPDTSFSTFNNEPASCSGMYDVQVRARDRQGGSQVGGFRFYAFEKTVQPLLLGMPWIQAMNPDVNWSNSTWRWRVTEDRITIEEPQAFVASVEESETLYAMVVCAVVAGAPDRPPEIKIPGQLKEYEDVFSTEGAGKLPSHGTQDHAIDLVEGKEPPYGPLYNLSATELKVLRTYLDDALAKGWIKHSISPAGAPILFVQKKDGSLRLCVDYRGLNAVTIKNRHPLPLIMETLDRLQGAKWFSKLDLKDAYHRIRIRKGDEWKTAFRTRYGHFEYLVMPFGLANAPATFQAVINKALAGLIDITCVVYLDDILIFAETEAEHWRRLKEVLERLRRYELFVSLKKCEFLVQEVEFLGFLVSNEGVRMDPARVEAIDKWPQPESYREIQVFLGFANFYRRFIHQYSKKAAPMTDLLKGMENGKKKGKFYFPDKAKEAFAALRNAFTEAPVLVHFSPDRPIRVETDASGLALAAILLQLVSEGGIAATPQWHPVAYWSRKMHDVETRYETHDQELLAIVASFEAWRHYLEGSTYPVTVLCDHNNLRYFMTTKVLNKQQTRWAMKLAAYDFEIKYRAGSKNPADGPSRRPDYMKDQPVDDISLPTLQTKLQAIGQHSDANVPQRRTAIGCTTWGETRGNRTDLLFA